MKLLLSPHFDDESLFAAFVCLREQPTVAFCFDGAPRHGSFKERSEEAAAAMAVLNCNWIALRATPETLTDELAIFDPEHVWAPWPEPGGNSEHNYVGDLAAGLWPDKVSFYTTYTDAGRTVQGARIMDQRGWHGLKLEALSCYRSQIKLPATRPHFMRLQDEYLVELAAV